MSGRVIIIAAVLSTHVIASFAWGMDSFENADFAVIDKGVGLVKKLYTAVRSDPTALLLQGIHDGDPEKVRDSLTRGASLQTLDQNKNNIVHIIAEKARTATIISQDKYVQILKIMKEHDSKLFEELLGKANNKGELPLHRAVCNTGEEVSCLEVVRVLVGKNDKYWCYSDNDDLTPLHYAMRSSVDLLKLVDLNNIKREVVQRARSYLDEAIYYYNHDNRTLSHILLFHYDLFANEFGMNDGKCLLETIDPSSEEWCKIITLLLVNGAYVPMEASSYNLLFGSMKRYLTQFELSVVTHLPDEDMLLQQMKDTFGPRSLALAIGQGNAVAVELMLKQHYLEKVPYGSLVTIYNTLSRIVKNIKVIVPDTDSERHLSYQAILEQLLGPYMAHVQVFLDHVRSEDFEKIEGFIEHHQNNPISPWAPRLSLFVMQEAQQIIDIRLSETTLSEDRRKKLNRIMDLLVNNRQQAFLSVIFSQGSSESSSSSSHAQSDQPTITPATIFIRDFTTEDGQRVFVGSII